MSDFLKRALGKAKSSKENKIKDPGNDTDNTDTLEGLVQGNSPFSSHRVKLSLKASGWIEIKSPVLETNLYIIRNDSIETPDPSLPRYTLAEVEALRGLSDSREKYIHKMKMLYKGKIAGDDSLSHEDIPFDKDTPSYKTGWKKVFPASDDPDQTILWMGYGVWVRAKHIERVNIVDPAEEHLLRLSIIDAIFKYDPSLKVVIPSLLITPFQYIQKRWDEVLAQDKRWKAREKEEAAKKAVGPTINKSSTDNDIPF